MNTDSLIQALASHATPVRPLPHPFKRYLYWLAPALSFVAAATAGIGLRADISSVFPAPLFLIQSSSLLLLALTAAASAFYLGTPGRRVAAVWWLPAVAFAGCAAAFLAPVLLETQGHAGMGLRCVRNIMLLSLPPAIALNLMLRNAFPLARSATGLLAFLGSFALGCLGTRFICPQEGMLHFLVWHCAPVVALAGIGALLGHFLLRRF